MQHQQGRRLERRLPADLTRRPYAPPHLTTYGSLRQLTRDTACNDNKDGGSNAICRRT